jgi:hypothetical protein
VIVSHQAHYFVLQHFVRAFHDASGQHGAVDATLMSLAQATAFFADRNGRRIRPAIATLASLLGKDPRAVQRALRRLEQLGWLRCVHRSSGGRGCPSEYEIILMVARANPGADAGVSHDENPGVDAAVCAEQNPGTSNAKPRHEQTETPASVTQNPGTRAAQSVRINKESMKNQKSRERELVLAEARATLGLEISAFDEWVSYRASIKKPLHTASLVKAAKQMAALADQQQAVVDLSISNSWQGLFPQRVRGGTNGSSHAPQTKADRMNARLDEYGANDAGDF